MLSVVNFRLHWTRSHLSSDLLLEIDFFINFFSKKPKTQTTQILMRGRDTSLIEIYLKFLFNDDLKGQSRRERDIKCL